MSANPVRPVISGIGTPRLIKEMAAVLFTSSATTTFSATTAVDAGAISADIAPGMRISAVVRTNVGGQDYDTISYAKALTVDVPGKTVGVDEWIGGTPTNGIAWKVDGWIADLPRTLAGGLRETYSPLVNVLNVYRNKRFTKSYGYDYKAILDYNQRMTPDALFELRWILQQNLEGEDEDVILIPRKDVPGINYPVFLEDPVVLLLHESQDFHKGLTLGFRGKAAVACPPQMMFGGYGTGYGRLYGTQL